ncbi:MAG: Hsp20/alpha crystallin family protein [Planctomycetes bacterium]|nr:Hsp20/alpha crystallin family protein [Planctomycetota bacterium]
MSRSLTHRRLGGGNLLRDIWDEGFSISEWNPRLDFSETEDGYLMEMDLPGINKEDISITCEDQVLTVSGERKLEKNEEGETLHRTERFHGRFSRSLRLPAKVDLDQVKAEVVGGVLSIRLPKAPEAKVRTIALSN